MAKKANQSLKDRLQRFRAPACRRSFFDRLSPDAQQFMLEVRLLYQKGEFPLNWKEFRQACVTDFPDDQWPVKPQTLGVWIQEK